MSGEIAKKLAELGIELAEPPKPMASYVGFVRHGDLVYVSGQLPFKDGVLAATGLLGHDISSEEASAAARLCAINILAQVKVACEGDLDRIVQCVRLGGFVASTPSFAGSPKVINGASDLMVEVLGEKGTHARVAVGVAVLPLNACVEVEATFAIK